MYQMDSNGSPWAEMGADYFVRALQDFARSSERKMTELSFEKRELETRVLELETMLTAKDRIIKEYLRRVALLEYALRKERAPPLVDDDTFEESPPDGSSEPASAAVTCREMLKQYLLQMDAMGINPFPTEDTSEEPSVRDDDSSWEKINMLRASLVQVDLVLFWRAPNEKKATLFTIVGSGDGLIRVWTQEPGNLKEPDSKTVVAFENTLNPRVVLRGHSASITCGHVVSRTGTLFTGDAEGDVFSWSLTEQLRSFEIFPSSQDLNKTMSKRYIGKLHAGGIVSLAAHATLPLLASAGKDRFVAISRLHASSVIETESIIPLEDSAVSIFWDSSAAVITAQKNGSLVAHEPRTGREIQKFNFGFRMLAAIDAGNNGLIVSLADGSFKLLDKKSFAVLSQFKQQASVGIVAATSGFKLAIAQGEGRIKVKDLRKLHHMDQGHTLSPCCEDARTTINCLAFSEQGDSLAASSSDGKVHIYRLV